MESNCRYAQDKLIKAGKKSCFQMTVGVVGIDPGQVACLVTICYHCCCFFVCCFLARLLASFIQDRKDVLCYFLSLFIGILLLFTNVSCPV